MDNQPDTVEEVTRQYKICSRCKVRKLRSEFSRRGDRGPGAVLPDCKVCRFEKHRKYMESPSAKAADRRLHKEAYAADPAVRAKALDRYKKNAPAARAAKLRREYSLTPQQWETLLDSQGGVCAICKGAQSAGRKSFCTDHDHATGKVRGLLCHPDSIHTLSEAVHYLIRHKG